MNYRELRAMFVSGSSGRSVSCAIWVWSSPTFASLFQQVRQEHRRLLQNKANMWSRVKGSNCIYVSHLSFEKDEGHFMIKGGCFIKSKIRGTTHISYFLLMIYIPICALEVQTLETRHFLYTLNLQAYLH